MTTTIEITTADGAAEAYLEGEGPGVLFYMDGFGLRPRIAEMADAIAGWGYTVLAPNVFYRDGSVAQLEPKVDLTVPENREAFFTSGPRLRIGSLTADRVRADAEAWVGELRRHCTPGPIGVTGYCMGARLALWTAGQFPDDVKAVGGFHGGGLVTDEPESPHRSIAASTAAYVLLHADNDPGLTPEHVAVLEHELTARGAEHVNEIVPGAPHGYTMSDTSSWDAAACDRHFAELRALLRRTIGS